MSSFTNAALMPCLAKRCLDMHTYIHKELVIVQNCSITIVCIRLLCYSEAFIQALSSTVVFFPKIEFFINLDLRIAVKCISNTLFDFKAYIVHR